jgi:peptidoglycan/xylan/chitin deacetylase (PgdA/CDA1 family)
MTTTVAVTFDNLGEAAELERGQWPEGEPLGRHFSVCEALPRLLEALREAGLHATFFVEGLNAELYPETLRELDAAGHEVACHGWRHEPWSELDPAEERERLERSVRGMGELGLRPVGFRPPGGELGPASLGTLRELGFRYCSPVGSEVETRGAIALVPFRWEHIDAFHYLPSFAALRERLTGSGEVLPPAALRSAVLGALDEVARGGGHLTLIFHPFLADTQERLDVIRATLQRIRDLGIRPVRGREVAG